MKIEICNNPNNEIIDLFTDERWINVEKIIVMVIPEAPGIPYFLSKGIITDDFDYIKELKFAIQKIENSKGIKKDKSIIVPEGYEVKRDPGPAPNLFTNQETDVLEQMQEYEKISEDINKNKKKERLIDNAMKLKYNGFSENFINKVLFDEI